MNFLWRITLLICLVVSSASGALSQGQITVKESTKLSVRKDSTLINNRVEKPKSLTFTASTDQRFFFFHDTRNNFGRRIPVGVYGIKAGFLFPARNHTNTQTGRLRASFKTGAGFYFVNQTIDRPGLLPGTSDAVKRHLRIVTGYFEKYLYRKHSIEVSVPLELGYGHSRYEEVSNQTAEAEIARGVFIPAGVGVLASYQFPAVRGFRPVHWFGINLLTGYRFILKKDIPDSQINYSGFYVSMGPSFFLENLTKDIKYWRNKRKAKKQK
ncbi:hypothetical protein [Fibrella aquatica]|uniref:hypothetical protein n=1 Tax=Fibrella aquatica TaxID=3242487 RepID=UPI003522FBCE